MSSPAPLVVVVMVACLASPSVALAQLRFTEVGRVTGPLVSAAPGPLAVADSGPAQATVFDGRTGATRILQTPAGCAISHASGNHAALLCYPDGQPYGSPTRVVVLNLRTGAQAVATVAPDLLTGTMEATAGAHWLELLVLHGFSEYSGKEIKSRVLVDWRTGSRIDEATDPFGKRALVDLDRPSARRRLCRPLRRLPESLLDYDQSRFASATLSPPWVLHQPDGDDATLQRCGSMRVRRIGGSAVVNLMDGVLVVQQHSARVTLQRLGSERLLRGTVPGVTPPSRTTVTAGRHFAFATVPTLQPGPTPVLRARLPAGAVTPPPADPPTPPAPRRRASWATPSG
jgi:hypothetical protein